MTVPLDKLYHYIESVAQDIRGDDVVIYRFYPHGSKKIEDLNPLQDFPLAEGAVYPHIYCNDQEPLNFNYYKAINDELQTKLEWRQLILKHGVPNLERNFTKGPTIFDRCILLHSEKRSVNSDLYASTCYINAYYWSHAIIASDWYRYARYEKLNKNTKKTFLIYNRAWCGTREYRLKFVDLLISKQLEDNCFISFNPIDPEEHKHYKEHNFVNLDWRPQHQLEQYFEPSSASASSSAGYDIDDYNKTDFEVVLETLFDDSRLHLTEKILRPIAVGQPFILAATHLSLEYLRSYGFKTFDNIIDETYDTIEDPVKRLEAIVNTMHSISKWSDEERIEKMKLANQITEYNKNHFFSEAFASQVHNELKTNLGDALQELENTNTSYVFLNTRKQLAQIDELKERVLSRYGSRQNTLSVVNKARQYLERHKLSLN